MEASYSNGHRWSWLSVLPAAHELSLRLALHLDLFLRCPTVLTLMASWDFRHLALRDGFSWLPHTLPGSSSFLSSAACLHDPFTLSYFMLDARAMCMVSQTAKSPFYSIRRGEYHPHSESFLLDQISLKTFGHTLQEGFHGDSEDHHRCIMGNSWCGSLEDAGEWGRGQKEAELDKQ